MAIPLVSWVLNNPILMCFIFPIGGKKFHNHRKNMWAPFDIQRLEVHVAIKHFANVGCTYSIKVLFTNVDEYFINENFLGWEGHPRAQLKSQYLQPNMFDCP
jgi:hypothetical protein